MVDLYAEPTEEEIECFLAEANRNANLTAAADSFCRASYRAMDLIMHLLSLSEMSDNLVGTYIRTFEDREPGEAEANRYVGYFRRQSQLLMEMVLCRLVDDFPAYVAELIREILHRNPHMLKATNETLSLEYVLGFDSIDDLRRDITERKIMALGYKGFHELNDWAKRRLGQHLIGDDTRQKLIVELVETRNAIVHNQSRVGAKYLANVADSPLSLGEVRQVSAGYLFRSFAILIDVAKAFDEQMSSKFGLPSFPSLASVERQ